MSRLKSNDFDDFIRYLRNYRIRDLQESGSFDELGRRLHRLCLGSLYLWARVGDSASHGVLEMGTGTLTIGSDSHSQLEECFADLTATTWAAVHGLMKPAGMSLRSAVETFVRGVGSIDSSALLQETNIYTLMSSAQALPIFSYPSDTAFTTLREVYKRQCAVAHSSPQHLTGTTNMSRFPKYTLLEMRSLVVELARVVGALSTVMVNASPSLYTEAPPRVRDLLDETIPREARIRALGGL